MDAGEGHDLSMCFFDTISDLFLHCTFRSESGGQCYTVNSTNSRKSSCLLYALLFVETDTATIGKKFMSQFAVKVVICILKGLTF